MASDPARPGRRGPARSGGRAGSTGRPGRPAAHAPGRTGPSRGGAARTGGRAGTRSPASAGPPSPGARPDGPRPGGGGAAGDGIRQGRAQRVAAATSGMLGVSSTRRAAILALVVCALMLSVAVPLRNFLGQRQELSRLQAEQRRLSTQVEQLSQERDRLRDPAEVAEEARTRLGYVRPGEIPFVVQLPDDPTTARRMVDPTEGRPWFETLWRDVKGVPR